VLCSKRYQIIAHPAQEALAKKLEASNPKRFIYHPTQWGKFKDGTDNIEVGGFYPVNHIRGEHVLFLASFHNNDVTLSQFHVLDMLCESFVQSMTILLPFYPTGGMERVEKEGTVPTACTLARLFSNMPFAGRPIRLMCYDLHTLQNRFYLSNSTLATLHTAIPLLIKALKEPDCKINCLAFPDEGACKRFKGLFEPALPDVQVAI
jgi:phosphoribosylpyrophosphate synthetase